MRQKVDNFKKEIRRKVIDQFFLQKRKDVTNHLQNQQRTVIINEQVFPQQPRKSYLEQQNVELEATNDKTRQTDIDVYEIWRTDLSNLENYLTIGQHERILLIMNEVYYTLKKIRNPKSSLHSKRSEIYKYFLRTGLLAKMVRSVLLAHTNKVALGLFQNSSKRMIEILQLVVQQEPAQFSQSLFMESNLLMLLRLCIDEPKLDKAHLSKILTIIIHMINVSDNETGQLFDKLNNKNEIFNFGAPFYNISKILIQPTEQITIQFIIMMKYYLLRIEDLRKLLQNKKDSIKQIKADLTPYQLDLAAQIAINSFHHFVSQDIRFLANEKDNLECLGQSLEVIRLLIQLEIMSTKFIDRIDYRKMIDLLTLSNIPSQIKVTILSLIDHLIFVDEKDKYSFVFIKNCDLLSTLWTLRNAHSGYVLNIFINIAYSRQFKADLNPYVHNIFISLKYETNNILIYNFIYNWFCSQDFEVLESRDRLILHLLNESTQTDEKITEMESLLWLRLLEKGECNVPLRILQLDNPSVRYIKELIKTELPL